MDSRIHGNDDLWVESGHLLECCYYVSNAFAAEPLMSKRILSDWLVFISLENEEQNRCVDLFERTDGTCGFEEFRRDVEDGGVWTPIAYHSVQKFNCRRLALVAAIASVSWLADAIDRHPSAAALLDERPTDNFK